MICDHHADKFTTMALNRGKFEPQAIVARPFTFDVFSVSWLTVFDSDKKSIHVSNREVVVRPA
jgi:hypothetical protein